MTARRPVTLRELLRECVAAVEGDTPVPEGWVEVQRDDEACIGWERLGFSPLLSDIDAALHVSPRAMWWDTANERFVPPAPREERGRHGLRMQVRPVLIAVVPVGDAVRFFAPPPPTPMWSEVR